MEGFDYSQGKFWLDALQLLGLVLLGIYTHITQRSKANAHAITSLGEESQQRLEDLRFRVDGIERRTDVMEQQLSHAPTHHDLAIAHKRLSRVAEQMEHMSGQLGAVNHQLTMVNEYLLNDKRGDR
ncbi:hypothetical protein [Halomonas sp.]|uniref:hypothetical protein n=1 Tax=Halomonas sp. TaxID=1486246 RepID=UPI00257AE05F|nr:hypothetical protein [Halomonas sp.]MCJ8285118.1 hypothetical protein [Halomonas sp.]NQY70168.1 hypothetical protein [Halomonas sp.]